jgi:hypothetical protein
VRFARDLVVNAFKPNLYDVRMKQANFWLQENCSTEIDQDTSDVL